MRHVCYLSRGIRRAPWLRFSAVSPSPCLVTLCTTRCASSQQLEQQQQKQQQQPMGVPPDAAAYSSPATSSLTPNASQESTNNAEAGAGVVTSYTPGSGTGAGLTVPTTALTTHCDVLAEAMSKMVELEQQRKAQNALGAEAQILTDEGMSELLQELQQGMTSEVNALVQEMRGSPVVRRAGMHELRRTLFYATTLHSKGWMSEPLYTMAMRILTVELLRREANGVLAPDDVLYVTTHMVAANFYNRHLWNRMEHTLVKPKLFDTVDLLTVKALTTKLFRTRPHCPLETLDLRRKILAAMISPVRVLANEFDLPSLLGILQCYTVHDMSPPALESLAIRATNHISELTPQECATLSHVLRRFRLMRLEVCEKLVERIGTADQLNQHMAHAALIAIRTCYYKVSEGGRGALHAEPTKQKLRALGEQIGCRLDEVEYPALRVILSILDIIVNLKIYVPKKPLQVLFTSADAKLKVVLEQRDVLVDPATGKHIRPVTMEEGRQLQALLFHYGNELAPELATRLREALRDGLLPDEASL